MSSTPAPRYVCPRCRTSFVEVARFCRECGADMQRVSPLERARLTESARLEAAVTEVGYVQLPTDVLGATRDAWANT